MKGISCFAFFCEDVRREASGKETVIGVAADVMTFRAFPVKVRRLQVYYRMRFEVGQAYSQIIIPSVEIDGKPVETASSISALPLKMINDALSRAEHRGHPYISSAALVQFAEPFPVQVPCQMLAFLNIGEERILCGALTLALKPSPETNASPHPSEQSPPDDPAS
ncbi:DUF6941 family protein [Bradyrhizobium sp. AUGA SZCCT0431]|uniref:DUF6941 family protein n=1 Tax=Bradyrhizobium sp. AUGA SZCCT0431 TaxID=2807674 RepID=UPI001BA5FFE0|nr:hypothetical protein [Bradyrhizobium sp. AUGA SZCCT0431]MBR1148370.1 hypothetical protein [Bradyrhizobium sp. AUGA SZCCT0431]